MNRRAFFVALAAAAAAPTVAVRMLADVRQGQLQVADDAGTWHTVPPVTGMTDWRSAIDTSNQWQANIIVTDWPATMSSGWWTGNVWRGNSLRGMQWR